MSSWNAPISTLPPPQEVVQKSYEELSGGSGKAVAYRAERHLVKDLIPDGSVVISLGGHKAAVHDMSLRGVSFWFPSAVLESSALQCDATLSAAVTSAGRSVFDGRARIVRHDPHGSKTLIAVELVGGMLDIVSVRKNQADAFFRGYCPSETIAQCDRVPDKYRDFLYRMSCSISSIRNHVKKYEQKYALLGIEMPDAREDVLELSAETWSKFRSEAGDIFSDLYHKGDQSIMDACKKSTEYLITSQLLDAPIVQRSYLKPLGYPGDFEMIMQLIRGGFEGETLLGRVFHHLACQEKLARGVRTRRDFLVDEIFNAYRNRQNKEAPFRVTSIACGPSREVVDFVNSIDFRDGEIEWTLLDQEVRALEMSYHDVCEAFARTGKRPHVRCVHMSFGQLLRSPMQVMQGMQQDVVYASGLFDYLRPRTARSLIDAMVEHTAPGGTVYVGNATDDIAQFWLTEVVLDWSLIPRSKRDMLSLVSDKVAAISDVSVLSEPSDAYYFLKLRR